MTKKSPNKVAKKTEKEPTVSVSLTATQFNIIMAGLQELPFKHSQSVINSLVDQAKKQIPEKPAPSAAPKE